MIRKYISTIKKTIILLVISTFLIHCGEEFSDDIPTSFTNVTDELSAGWECYQSGKYAEAKTHFITVAERDAEVAEAYNGLGWTYLRSKELSNAASQFSFVLSLAKLQGNTIIQADAYAGMFLMNYIKQVKGKLDGELSEAQAEEVLVTGLQYADSALKLNPEYSSDHDPDFDVIALKKLMAYSYYSMCRFSESLDFVDETVLSSINVDTLTEEVHLQSDDNGNVFGILPSGGAIKILEVKDKSVLVWPNQGDTCWNDYTPVSEAEYFEYHLQGHNRMVFPSIDSKIYPQRTDTLTSFKLADIYKDAGIMLPTPRTGVFQVYSVYYLLDPEKTELRYWIYEPGSLVPTFFKWNFVKIHKDYDYIVSGNKFVLTYSYRNYEVKYLRTDDFLELIKLLEAYF
ncbi:MAG TPA: tetratricopeptide repeat protein [Candidatus Marinimicrobia bacterium]|nr:tetratricopeptide repeat protein [Candidatus Neomarinimicrobiota bacterium]HQM36194.1 tetratricopeptide repeat protein [Candidatus Neomarinimicrobiota bacterium]